MEKAFEKKNSKNELEELLSKFIEWKTLSCFYSFSFFFVLMKMMETVN